MTLKRARGLVAQYTAYDKPEIAEKVALRMVETGECVWHAVSQVTGQPCWCNDCAAPKP